MTEAARKIDWPNRLAKWRTLFAGWQLGTRPKGEPESDAVRDHREVTMLLRAEVNALTALLIQKKVLTTEEFSNQLDLECQHLCEAYSRRFPGVEATDAGLNFDLATLAARGTMAGWKP